MDFGLTFFPEVEPAQKPAAEYFHESLDLIEEAEKLGYTHVRSIEHHFTGYGGYSPDSILMLTAAAVRSKKMQLITGAVIPAFNHPVRVAEGLAMLDAISNGRLQVGFGRGFLPYEFANFKISRDDSIARFREGMEQVDLLLREENATSHGRFHSFDNITTQPRPTQKPRPPFFVAANITEESYEYAGRHGHSIMVVPMTATRLRQLLEIYHDAYRAAGHPGRGKVFLSFHMFVDPDGQRARDVARPHVESYFRAVMRSLEGIAAQPSDNYKGYEKQREHLAAITLDSLIESGGAFVGSPAEVREQITRFREASGGFDYASLQVNFHLLPYAESLRSLTLFAHEVMPHFAAPVVMSGVP